MTKAEQIVEAEIGPQDDIGQFVGGALKADFLLNRLGFKKDIRTPFVYDKENGSIVCYLLTHWTGNDPHLPSDENQLSYKIDVSGTFHLMQSTLKRDPGYANWELRELSERWFGSWQAAMRFFLSMEASQNWMKEGLLIEATGKHISALGYQAALERLVQTLARRGFLTEKVERRAGKGTSCYLLGRSGATTAAEVCQIVQDAGKMASLVVQDAKAAMRNETTWQVDFNAANLFESDEIEQFVTTAFREEVPGHADLERLDRYKNYLHHNGLPVYKFVLTTFLSSSDGRHQIEVRAYWDNSITNYSKTTASRIATVAAEAAGYDPEVVPVYGHGYGSHVIIMVPTIGKPMNVHNLEVTAESQDDYEAFGEIAAARQGTIADELRLKRLVDYLKSYGLRVGECNLDQQMTIVGSHQNYMTVWYTLKGIYSPKLSMVDSVAREQVKQIAFDYLNGPDREITDAGPLPPSDIRVEGRPMSAKGIVLRIGMVSLRKPSPIDDQEQMANLKYNFESEDPDMEEYADVAQQGIKSRMWLQALRKNLESRQIDVRELRLSYPDGHSAMRLLIYANGVAKDQFEPEYKRFTSKELMQHFYDAIKATGVKIVLDNPMYPKPNISGDRRPIDDSMVYVARFYVESPEPFVNWTGDIFEALMDFDDMGIGEHERLAALMKQTEIASQRNPAVNPIQVVWGRAEKGFGTPTPATYFRVRILCANADDALWSFAKAITAMKVEPVHVSTSYPGMGRVKQMSVRNKVMVDMYVFLPSVSNLEHPITLPGPAAEIHPEYVNLDEPNRMLEAFDPEDETWLRRAVDRWPGVADLHRLKDAIREIEKSGLDVIGVNQVRKKTQEANGTVAEVMISIRLPVNQPERQGTPGVIADMRKITSALSYWDILDLRFEYDTLDMVPHRDRFRVFTWYWLSHNSAEDMVPLNLRKGQWDEYMAAGHGVREDEMFLVEQFEAPGDEPGYEMPDIEQFTSDVVDPYWRERLRLRAIANDIKAAGWDGWLHLQGKETHINSPTLWFNLWKDEDHTDYHVKQLIRELNQKHHFSSDGNIWAHLHDLRNQRVAKRPGENNETLYAWTVSFPYMYADRETPELTKNTPIQKSQVHVYVNEALDWTPSDMANFGKVAATPDRQVVVRNAFQALQDCFKRKYPGLGAFANMMWNPRPGGLMSVEMSVHTDLPQDEFERLKRWEARDAIIHEFRDAVLKSGLGRYKPKQVIYYKWPSSDIYLSQETSSIWIVKFTMRNMGFEAKHFHVSNIHEGFDMGDVEHIAQQGTMQFGVAADIEQGFYAMKQAVQALAPGQEVYSRIEQDESEVEEDEDIIVFRYRITVPPGFFRKSSIKNPQVAYNVQQTTNIEEKMRAAFHQTILAQYMPEVYAASAWPEVRASKFTHGPDMIDRVEVYIRFGISGLNHQPVRVNEALDIDPEGFVQGALPDIEDRNRLKAMLDQWAQFSNYVQGGVAWADRNTLALRPGQRRGPYRYRTDITIQALAKVDSMDYVEGAKTWVLQELLQLLANHGFGTFVIDNYAIGNHTMRIGNLYIRSLNRNGWKISLIGADVAHKGFQCQEISFGDLQGIDESAFDPAEFMAGADRESQYGLYATLGQIAASLRSKGWIGYMHCKGWPNSKTMHNLVINLASTGPGQASIKQWEKKVAKDIADATKGLFKPDPTEAIPTFVRKQLRGYEDDYSGFYYWYADLILDLQGRVPLNQYALDCDIETGAVTMQDAPPGWGEVGG